MDAFETYLLQLPRYGDKGAKAMHPGFERVNALVAAMNHPHRQFASIHIAGTNGKGSTASMVAAILRAAGHSRVGLYTSPHLTCMRERIRCDGAMVPVMWMNVAVARFRHVMDAVQPSFFEAMTALAFLYFAEQEVSVAIVEAGLGGRLDATNILEPRLSIITCIDLDHMNVLGHSLSAIAREKGGIIKPGVPLLTATRQPEALAVLEAIGAHLGAPIHVTHRECQMDTAQGADGLELTATTPRATYSALTLELSGTHQAANALLAIRAAELLYGNAPAAIRTGLQRVRALSGLRGRLETLAISPRVILDVAHNEAGLRSALAYARPQCHGRLFVLFGLVRSKDAAKMAQALFEARAIVYTCDVPARRGLNASELADILRVWHVPIACSGTWEAAFSQVKVRAAPEDWILVCGSHHLAGEFLGPYA